MNKKILSALILLLIIVVWFYYLFNKKTVNKNTFSKEKIESIWKISDTNKLGFKFIEEEFDFWKIKQSGWIVSHDFKFTYNGKKPIKIISTPGSCLCTSATIDKKKYNPGDSWILTVKFNPNLHGEPDGRFFKTVTIITKPALENNPEIKVWQEIDLDLWEEAFELNNPKDLHKEVDWHHENNKSKLDVKKEIIKSDKIIISNTNTIEEISNNAAVYKIKPLKKGEVRKFTLTAKEVVSTLADWVKYNYWTFNWTVPWTFMRVMEGDQVEITLINDKNNKNKHSIDLHAVNGPGWWAWATSVYPGQQKIFRFKALNPGIYIYHCATSLVPEHIANWMYWLILVEPKEGLPKVDREYAIVQGEFYTILKRWEKWITGFSTEKMYNENPEYIVFNGRVWGLMWKRTLKAKVWEKVRLYVGNWWVWKVSSFHVIGEIFDTVYPEWWTPVQNNIQTTVVPTGWATIVEFKVDVPWVYKIVDHALSRLTKWAIATITVEGNKDLEIFNKNIK